MINNNTKISRWYSPYNESFRKHVHQLLAWGYYDASPRLDPHMEEEEITGFIVEAIQKKLSSSAPRHFDRFSVKENVPVPTGNRAGKRRMRIDIIVESSSARPRPEYNFEAKRLCAGSHPISGYMGNEGLQCFIRGDYADKCPEAAMVGYMQNRSVDYWFGELTRVFVRNAHKDLFIVAGLEKVDGFVKTP